MHDCHGPRILKFPINMTTPWLPRPTRGNVPVAFRLACAARAICLLSLAMATAGAAEAQARKGIQPLLQITWTEGPEYPMGIQDSACGVVKGKFISAGGFSRHPKDIVKRFPGAFGGKASGFTNLAFSLDLTQTEKGWTRIPDLPGPARQAAATAVVGDALYAIGGFSYTTPFTYRSTYRLQQDGGGWAWTDTRCDTPWPVCEASAVVIGEKIYLVGAADFFDPPGSSGEQNFYTEAGRDNSPVGRALLVLDPKNLAAGWKRLTDFPGTPRSFCSAAAAGGKIYVLSGLYSPAKTPANPKGGFYNTVDSWVYDPAVNAWARLPDVPDDANVRAVTVKDRYLLLIGGYKYGETWRLDGTRVDVFSPEEKKATMAAMIQKTVLVYDTVAIKLGAAAPLLDQSSWPLVAVDGNTVYCLGGEGGARLWHPATFQIGRIADDEPYSDWPED